MLKTKTKESFRDRLYNIIFYSDTKAGKSFDVILLISIVASVFIVMLDSVVELRQKYSQFFFLAEWIFTLLFTLEYITRIAVSRKPVKYIISFYGIIDLLSILPTFLSLFLAGSHFLLVIRILRMLRIFRILKLSRYLKASHVLQISLKQSKYKIIVFLEVVLTIVVIMGSMMYLIEGPENGFSSIPKSIYWAIVTLTTVGFGDITPQTIAGQFFASIIMILGYSIIAVPTGIISAELFKAEKTEPKKSGTLCRVCNQSDHDEDASYCKFCGRELTKEN
ncbi:MAG: ion transporter [Bacteroidales bacterium]|nr:ion transporter [Bacteroidales bacterium]